MDEESKKSLYNQLVEMYESEYNIKENKEEIISEEEFMAFSDADALKYVFNYRDNNTYFEIEGERCDCYISLPDINLEGQDLTGLVISKFRLGDVSLDGNSYKLGEMSIVNLKDTNATINLSKIEPNEIIEENEREYLAINFEFADFHGCNVFGILPDEYEKEESKGQGRFSKRVKVIGKEEALDEEYLKRREENHLSEEDKKISDRVYQKLLKGESLKGMRGVGSENDRKRVNLIDYDFSEIAEDEEIRENFEENVGIYYLDYRNTGAKLIPSAEYGEVRNNEIIMNEYNAGNIDFLKKEFLNKKYYFNGFGASLRHFDEKCINFLNKSNKKAIAYAEYKKGNLNFLLSLFEYLPEEVRIEIIKNEYEKGNIEFLKDSYKYLSKDERIEIIKNEYEKGNIDFVDEHFYDLTKEVRSDIANKEYEKGNLEFVESSFGYLSNEIISEIVNKEYEKGNLEFVESNFHYLSSKDIKEIIIKECKKGNFSFFKNFHGYLLKEERIEIIKNEYEKENLEFVERWFEVLLKDDMIKIMKKEYEKGNSNFIKKYLEKEKKEKEIQGQKEVSCDGKLLYDELSKENINKEFILSLIQAGSGVNYTGYLNADRQTPEYIPTLYKALTNISNEKDRKEIVQAMLDAGANPNSCYMKRHYDNYDSEKNYSESISCMDVNLGELQEIMKNRKNRIEKSNDPNNPGKIDETIRSEKTDEIIKPENTNSIDMQKVIIYNYLTNQVGLNAEEIENLENVYSEYNRDLYSENIENNLDLKKKILDVCKATKQGFTKNYRILFSSPQTLYSKLKFFKEFGIEIDFENLDKTLSSSNKYFARKYGELYIEQGDMDEKEYAKLIQRKLSELYPMPKNIDELDRELEQFRENEEREVV